MDFLISNLICRDQRYTKERAQNKITDIDILSFPHSRKNKKEPEMNEYFDYLWMKGGYKSWAL